MPSNSNYVSRTKAPPVRDLDLTSMNDILFSIAWIAFVSILMIEPWDKNYDPNDNEFKIFVVMTTSYLYIITLYRIGMIKNIYFVITVTLILYLYMLYHSRYGVINEFINKISDKEKKDRFRLAIEIGLPIIMVLNVISIDLLR